MLLNLISLPIYTGCPKNDVTSLIGCSKSVGAGMDFSFSGYTVNQVGFVNMSMFFLFFRLYTNIIQGDSAKCAQIKTHLSDL